MADYHTTYKGPEGETTQWDDIQVRLGNKAAPPPKHKAEKFEAQRDVTKDADWLASKDEQELSDLEDDFEDDRELEYLRYDTIYRLQSVFACFLSRNQTSAGLCVLRPRFFVLPCTLKLSCARRKDASQLVFRVYGGSSPRNATRAYVSNTSFLTDLPACRQKRIEEMRSASSRPRYGTLEFIRGAEFQQKVTERSTSGWVTVLLFKDECVALTIRAKTV